MAKATDTTQTGEFAVIETGGKQYMAKVGDVLTIEKLADNMTDGDKVIFDKVVLFDNGTTTTMGTPYIAGTKVEGILEEQGKTPKLTVTHFKSKSNYHRTYGHRQPFMKVKITALK